MPHAASAPWYPADVPARATILTRYNTDRGTSYARYDATSNVTAIADEEGTVVERYVYDPYGERTVLDADWSADGDGQSDVGWVYGHQGGRHDLVAGLVHFRFRDLDTSLGRWTTQDPLGYVDGLNLYSYVNSSPIVWFDPSGLSRSVWIGPIRFDYHQLTKGHPRWPNLRLSVGNPRNLGNALHAHWRYSKTQIILSPKYYRAGLRSPIGGRAGGIGAAGASAAIITYLAMENVRVRYVIRAIEGQQALDDGNQASISDYWQRNMDRWATGFLVMQASSLPLRTKIVLRSSASG